MAKAAASPRVPLELQQIFLASNAGATVDEPPAGLGFKVFKRVFRLVSSRKMNTKKKGPRKAMRSVLNQSPNILSSSSNHSHLSPTSHADEVDDYESPHALLESILCERGYSTMKCKAAETSFRFKPTQYELASFNSHTLKVIEEDPNDVELRNLLQAGISPNACNRDGEPLMHRACRLGKHQHVRLFLEFGADLRICSAFGRTALHDTCYGQRPSFQTFAVIVEKDPSLLLMMDSRGLCPLEYIRKDHYVFWFEYLERNVEKFWPMRAHQQKHLSLEELGRPFSRTLSKPANALPPELAHMLATGRMTTKEVSLLVDDDSGPLEYTQEPISKAEAPVLCSDDCNDSVSSESSSDETESSSDDDSSFASYDELFFELGLE